MRQSPCRLRLCGASDPSGTSATLRAALPAIKTSIHRSSLEQAPQHGKRRHKLRSEDKTSAQLLPMDETIPMPVTTTRRIGPLRNKRYAPGSLAGNQNIDSSKLPRTSTTARKTPAQALYFQSDFPSLSRTQKNLCLKTSTNRPSGRAHGRPPDCGSATNRLPTQNSDAA